MIIEKRQKQLDGFIKHYFKDTSVKLSPLAGDASFRHYLRLEQKEKRYIVMDAPPPEEDVHPFIDIAARLQKVGLSVPHIYHQDVKNGFLLLSDLGDKDYFSVLNRDNADTLYRQAIDALIILQQHTPTQNLPPFDTQMIEMELSIFTEWYLKEHLNMANIPDLSEAFKALIDNAITQPQVAVHRDYHSRNLMIINENSPGLLDFQDMVVGPLSYDLVSLLKDCYIAWDEKDIERWVNYYLAQNTIAPKDFQRQFDLTGLQRHLKAIGIFCRLNYRDNKSSYLNNIPLVLKYVQSVADKYTELKGIRRLISELP